MKILRSHPYSWFTLVLLLAFASPVYAQVAANSTTPVREENESPIEIELILLAATDFRYRGISYSDKGPVFQPEITVSHTSGLYADLWASNIGEYNGANTELDLSLGLEREIGPLTLDIGATASFFPGGSNTDFVELYALTGAQLGSGKIELQTHYAPSQANIGGEDNLYVGLAGRLPLRNIPLTLHASFGIEDGAFGDSKRDWSIGASARVLGFDVCARYVDTARTRGDPFATPGAILSVSRTIVLPRRDIEHSGCPSF